MMLFTPILLTGALVLASTTRDMMTTVETIWTYVLITASAVTFPGGGFIWWRSRQGANGR